MSILPRVHIRPFASERIPKNRYFVPYSSWLYMTIRTDIENDCLDSLQCFSSHRTRDFAVLIQCPHAPEVENIPISSPQKFANSFLNPYTSILYLYAYHNPLHSAYGIIFRDATHTTSGDSSILLFGPVSQPLAGRSC